MKEAGKGKGEEHMSTPVGLGEKVEIQPKKTNPDESNQAVPRNNMPPFKEPYIRDVSLQFTKDDLRQDFKPLGSINHYMNLDEK